MDGLELGPYGVVARGPGGSVASVERSFAEARRHAAQTLIRFGGNGLVDGIPREPGALVNDYGNAFAARLRRGRGEIALVRFHEDHDAGVPLEDPRVLAIRVRERLCRAVLVDGTRLAWDAANALCRQIGDDAMRFDVYVAADQRPRGGLLMRGEPRLVSAGQLLERWARRVGGEVNFDDELERVMGTG